MSDHKQHPFEGLRVPGPRDSLKGRALDQAREAASTARPPDVWTRIARSRKVRLAWAALVVLLAGAHLSLSFLERGPTAAPVLAENHDLRHEFLAEVPEGGAEPALLPSFGDDPLAGAREVASPW